VELSGTGGSSPAPPNLSTMIAPPPTPVRYTASGIWLPSDWCGRSPLVEGEILGQSNHQCPSWHSLSDTRLRT